LEAIVDTVETHKASWGEEFEKERRRGWDGQETKLK